MRCIRCAPKVILALGVVAIVIAITSPTAQAVILYKSAIRNKSAPTGIEANSGWQYEGNWAGGFVGTPIAPHYFISASHLGGGVGGAIYYKGKNYTTTAAYDDPSTDLKIYKINGTFPSYAPIYTLSSEVGKTAVVYGRGTGRGNAVVKNGQTKGWLWATQDKVMSWGDNKVSSTLDGGSGFGQLLKFTFDKVGTANEGALSTGDSGGGVFINDNGKWKLAGINYLVDGPFSLTSGGPQFQASLYDKGGLYINGNQSIADTAANIPGAWYATRISSRQSWIKSVIGTVPTSSAALTAADLSVTSAVPEPASLGLFAGIATLLLRRRR